MDALVCQKLYELLQNLLMTSASKSVAQLPIEAVAKRNERIFALYIVVLVVTGLLVAFFTWLVWDAGNKVQDAIRDNANAKIAEAGKDAAEANERSKVLEQSNLRLQSTVAQQQERAAAAEKELLQLKETLKDRVISDEQEQKLRQLLAGEPNGPVEVWWITSDKDSYPLALKIIDVLKKAGWTNVTERMAVGGTGDGFFIIVHEIKTAPAYASRLQQAFKDVGIHLEGHEKPDTPPGVVQIYIGHKAHAL
jgi:hypothetical protein